MNLPSDVTTFLTPASSGTEDSSIATEKTQGWCLRRFFSLPSLILITGGPYFFFDMFSISESISKVFFSEPSTFLMLW